MGDKYYIPGQISTALESMETQCSSACTITVTLWRKRWLSDAAIGVAVLRYDNAEAITALQIDVKPPGSGGEGRPIGSLTIEADCILHRYRALDAIARKQMASTSTGGDGFSRGRSPAGTDGAADGSPSPPSATEGAEVASPSHTLSTVPHDPTPAKPPADALPPQLGQGNDDYL